MINLIACVGLNNELGYKQDLLCHLPNDLAFFKEKTTGSICIQGRKTYQSIVDKLGKPLPSRTNIVLTRDKNFNHDPSVYVYHSVKDILNEYYNYGEGEIDVYVIGGGEIYKIFLEYADRIYLTVVENKFKADTWFPKLSDSWKVTSRESHQADDKHEYPYHFLTYERK